MAHTKKKKKKKVGMAQYQTEYETAFCRSKTVKRQQFDKVQP